VKTGILQRIRWANVARAGAVVAALLLAIAWPKLRDRPDPLPPAAAVPAVVEDAQAAAPAETATVAEQQAVSKRRPKKAARSAVKAPATAKPRPSKHRAPRRKPRRARAVAQPTPPAAPPAPRYIAPAYTPPAPPPGAEFRP
jgi:hypothetical protein